MPFSRDQAFLQVLLLAKESGLLRLGTVAIDGTKLDANASKIRSVRYDRAKELRARPAAEIARRQALKARLDAACARLEEQARAEAARPEYEAKRGRHRGRPPVPPEDGPPPTRQAHPTEPWRLAMLAKLEKQDAKDRYARRKQTVQPAFGSIKAAMGFSRFRLRGRANVAAEGALIALACNSPDHATNRRKRKRKPDRLVEHFQVRRNRLTTRKMPPNNEIARFP